MSLCIEDVNIKKKLPIQKKIKNVKLINNKNDNNNDVQRGIV